jgi:hypothetical protein
MSNSQTYTEAEVEAIRDSYKATIKTERRSARYYAALIGVQAAFFAVYLCLFILAIWLSRRSEGVFRRIQLVLGVSIFVCVMFHQVFTTLYSYMMGFGGYEDGHFTETFLLATNLINHFSTVITGLLSDSVVAWRFYALYNQKRWTMVTSVVLLLIGLVGGICSGIYICVIDDITKLGNITTEAWAWVMFATNTFLTTLIIVRLCWLKML